MNAHRYYGKLPGWLDGTGVVVEVVVVVVGMLVVVRVVVVGVVVEVLGLVVMRI